MKSQHDYMLEYLQWCKDNPTRRVTFYGWMILMEYAPQAEQVTIVRPLMVDAVESEA